MGFGGLDNGCHGLGGIEVARNLFLWSQNGMAIWRLNEGWYGLGGIEIVQNLSLWSRNGIAFGSFMSAGMALEGLRLSESFLWVLLDII